MKKLFKHLVVSILTLESRILLRRTKPFIVAVTGSVGKTSTKDAIYAAISKHKQTRKSLKSYNSEIGIPLSVLGLNNAWDNPFLWLKNIVEGMVIALFSRDYPDVLILEAGVDRPGDMKSLAKWLRPDVVVMTRLPNIPVHVEYFASPEAVIAEKMELVKALRPDGAFIYNHDDTNLQKQLANVRQRQVGFSRIVPTDFTARADQVVYDNNQPVGMEFAIEHGEDKESFLVKGVLGVPVTYAVAAASAVAAELGISLKTVAVAMDDLELPSGRMRLLPGIKNTTIIDDTYNSSPIALELALIALKNLEVSGRKIAVIGDMLELGQYSSEEHEKVGVLVPECCEVLVTVGVRARKIAEKALENGMNEQFIFQYDEAERAGKELQNYLLPKDVVLIKASQGIRAETIVEEIMAEPERASELLVRQSRAWEKR